MKWLSRYFRLLIKDQKGNVLIMVAASMIMLMGMTALVIDVGQLYSARRQMVNAADAAALAGAFETKNNTNHARSAAKEYAERNGAEGFCEDSDVFFTGEGEFRIISVRTTKLVDFTFARVLGFESSTVEAIASARVGPGNQLVPFVDVGFECDECDGEGEICVCAICGEESENCTDCENCDGEGENCTVCSDCEGDGCTECDDDGENCLECPECGGEGQVGHCSSCDDMKGVKFEPCPKCGGNGYFMRTVGEGINPEDYKAAEKGDHFEIKYDRWQNWLGDTSGTFPYIRLPEQTGANDLYENLAGGYTGDLSDVAIGTDHRGETGQTHGKMREAMFTRMTIHGVDDDGRYCSYGDFKCGDWYKCDLVVVLPLVIEYPPKNKHYEIVGYATVLLDGNSYDGEKNVEVWFLEYLTYEQLEYKLTEQLEGFVNRLVQDPEEALNHFRNTPSQLASP